MKIEHRTRDKQTNADGLSRKTNFYRLRDKRESEEGEVRKGFSFLDQGIYDTLLIVNSIDKIHIIEDHREGIWVTLPNFDRVTLPNFFRQYDSTFRQYDSVHKAIW